jgi:hypothetical protein
MKKPVLLLMSLALTMALSTSALAFTSFMDDVNNSCGYTVVSDCIDCHDPNDYKTQTVSKDLYLTEGACGFCPESTSCTSAPPTMDQLLVDAQNTTKAYFERLFREFMSYLTAVQDPNHPSNTGKPFADVFEFCPQIAPEIASDFSRDTGYLVRRVTERTRNSRNTPDDWELLQLRKFAQMAANGEPRTEFIVNKPNPDNIDPPPTLTTKEYEIYEVVFEPDVKGKDKKVAGEPRAYFRYMRSITMPGMPTEPPNLPCLLCHGTQDQLAPGVVAEVAKYYPYDQAVGYAKGDIRGAWSIKIPLDALPQ